MSGSLRSCFGGLGGGVGLVARRVFLAILVASATLVASGLPVACPNASLLAADPPPTIHDSLGQVYRLVEAGHFEMGSREPTDFRLDHASAGEIDDDQPIHPVILTRPFYIASNEVTVDQFRRFVEATGHRTSAEINQGAVGWDPQQDERERATSFFTADKKFSWRNPGFAQQPSHPVVGVSYHDANAYCRWLGEQDGHKYRLPTEAEWERACRGGTDTHFSFGDAYRRVIHQHANVANVELERQTTGFALLHWLIDVDVDPGDGHPFTAPVGSYQANPLGLHDMHGNVWEWCEDAYLDTYYQQFAREDRRKLRPRAIDPVCRQEWNSHGQWRVIRGGAWCLPPAQCRSGTRGVFEANDAACYVGFRVVREASDEAIQASEQSHRESETALQRLQAMADSIREDRDGTIHLELRCRDLSDEVFQWLGHLNYSLDLMIRPPDSITSQQIQKLAAIQHLAGLGISTSCEDLDDNTFAFLSEHPELEQLQITGSSDLSNALFEHLRGADRLTSLNLQGDAISDAGFAKLPPLKRLSTLFIASTSCCGVSLDRFQGSPLRQASFRNLSDVGANQLVHFPSLQHLHLQHSPITGQGLEAIAQLRNLSDLNLTGCDRLKDEDFRVLGRLPLLRSLELTATAAGDEAADALRPLSQIQHLRIGSANLSDRGLVALCELVSLRQLSLDAAATEITDGGLRDVWRLAHLEDLTILAPGIQGEGLAVLAELPKLRRLTIAGRGLTDAALHSIASLDHLTELHVGDWNQGGPPALTDEGLLQLAKAKQLKSLTLIRRGTTIRDEAIAQLQSLRSDLRVRIQE